MSAVDNLLSVFATLVQFIWEPKAKIPANAILHVRQLGDSGQNGNSEKRNTLFKQHNNNNP